MDNNYYSVADQSDVEVSVDLTPDNPSQYNDILKFSNAKRCAVRNKTISGGSEDCIDLNRFCDGITVERCHLFPYGKQGITMKGGSKNLTLSDVVFYGEAGNVEIELGNYSEQSDDPPINIFLYNVSRFDGNKVRVKCLNACPCTVHVYGGSVDVYKPWWVKLGFFKIYCWLRKKNIIK